MVEKAGRQRRRTEQVAVFDFGGVLTSPIRVSIEAWVRRERIHAPSVTRVLRAWLGRNAPPDNPLHRLERGLLEQSEFNVLMAGELDTVAGSPVRAEGLLTRFFADVEIDPEMVRVIEDLRSAGVRTTLLSNSWGDDYPAALLDRLFDVQVISSRVGMRKPDAEIFQLTAERSGVSVEQLVFIDDGAPNVRAAEAIGITSHLHTDAASTREALRSAFPGRTSSPLD